MNHAIQVWHREVGVRLVLANLVRRSSNLFPSTPSQTPCSVSLPRPCVSSKSDLPRGLTLVGSPTHPSLPHLPTEAFCLCMSIESLSTWRLRVWMSTGSNFFNNFRTLSRQEILKHPLKIRCAGPPLSTTKAPIDKCTFLALRTLPQKGGGNKK